VAATGERWSTRGQLGHAAAAGIAVVGTVIVGVSGATGKMADEGRTKNAKAFHDKCETVKHPPDN
jgi:hypothetical protein